MVKIFLMFRNQTIHPSTRPVLSQREGKKKSCQGKKKWEQQILRVVQIRCLRNREGFTPRILKHFPQMKIRTANQSVGVTPHSPMNTKLERRKSAKRPLLGGYDNNSGLDDINVAFARSCTIEYEKVAVKEMVEVCRYQ